MHKLKLAVVVVGLSVAGFSIGQATRRRMVGPQWVVPMVEKVNEIAKNFNDSQDAYEVKPGL